MGGRRRVGGGGGESIFLPLFLIRFGHAIRAAIFFGLM